MGSFERRQMFKELIDKLNEPQIRLLTNDKSPKPMQLFFGTYLGLCFIQGYRIQQKIGDNILLLSQMSYQNSLDYPLGGVKKLHGNYRILNIQFKEDLNSDKELRLKVFEEIKQLIQFVKDGEESISEFQIHFIFVSTFKYSIVDKKFLTKGSSLDVANFYERNYGFPNNRGYKMANERMQGIKLHYLVEIFLKGSGIIRNNKVLEQEVLHHSKFNYSPEKVINTICFILGKQMIQGKYITITSEKWMRKSTVKRFKRFDLLLRNDEKVCIIDWKFSKVDAHYKMTANRITDRNKAYFQLARKQFNSNVQLKFYCFHQKTEGKYHHKFTVAEYRYDIQSVDISDGQINLQDSDDQSLYMLNQMHFNNQNGDKMGSQLVELNEGDINIERKQKSQRSEGSKKSKNIMERLKKREQKQKEVVSKSRQNEEKIQNSCVINEISSDQIEFIRRSSQGKKEKEKEKDEQKKAIDIQIIQID